MTEITAILSEFKAFAAQLLSSGLSFGSFTSAVMLVTAAYFVGMISGRYSFRSLIPKIKSSTVTAALYYMNLLAFGPIVFLLRERIQQLYDNLMLPTINAAIWSDIPLPILVVLSLLAYDFSNYWAHRCLHKKWLWPVHSIHHSDSLMNGLTLFRIHFIESIVMGVFFVFLLTWLALPDVIISSSAILITLYGVYIHMEMDWTHGPLRYLLASPRFHHWHHADAPEAYGKNLANIYPFLDVLFGTYYVPGKCDVHFGAPGVPERNPLEMLLHPFKEWSSWVTRYVKTMKIFH